MESDDSEILVKEAFLGRHLIQSKTNNPSSSTLSTVTLQVSDSGHSLPHLGDDALSTELRSSLIHSPKDYHHKVNRMLSRIHPSLQFHHSTWNSETERNFTSKFKCFQAFQYLVWFLASVNCQLLNPTEHYQSNITSCQHSKPLFLVCYEILPNAKQETVKSKYCHISKQLLNTQWILNIQGVAGEHSVHKIHRGQNLVQISPVPHSLCGLRWPTLRDPELSICNTVAILTDLLEDLLR